MGNHAKSIVWIVLGAYLSSNIARASAEFGTNAEVVQSQLLEQVHNLGTQESVRDAGAARERADLAEVTATAMELQAAKMPEGDEKMTAVKKAKEARSEATRLEQEAQTKEITAGTRLLNGGEIRQANQQNQTTTRQGGTSSGQQASCAPGSCAGQQSQSGQVGNQSQGGGGGQGQQGQGQQGGGGGQGQGGEQGGAGSAIAGGLMAIGQAAGVAGAAAAQASADKAVARTNAAAQIAMTQISADTSKYLADGQKQIAQMQSTITAQMAEANNDAQTERLQMQIADLKDQRLMKSADRAEERKIEIQLQREKILLAKEESAQRLQLARQELNAQITAAGLSQGFVSKPGFATGSAKGLTVTRTFNPTATSTAVASNTRVPNTPATVGARTPVGLGTAMTNQQHARGIASVPDAKPAQGRSIVQASSGNISFANAASAVNASFRNDPPAYLAWASKLSFGSSRDLRIYISPGDLTPAELNWFQSRRDMHKVAGEEAIQ